LAKVLLEIKVQNDVGELPYTGTGCNPTILTLYYGWNGTEYVDISPILDVSYWPEINEYWEYAAQQDGCLMFWRIMYEMLMGYHAMGRLDEGWRLLEPQLRWDECPEHTLEDERYFMDGLLEWIEQHLPSSDAD
jgi:hypothetical protein